MKLMNFGIVIPLVAGWIGGWVVNYLADTLPRTRRLSGPVCPHCGERYPVVDYLLFRGCAHCGHSRSTRPWLVQAAMLAVSLLTWFRPQPKIGYALGLLLLTYFAVVVVIDLEHRLILHPTSIVGALLALALGWRLNDYDTGPAILRGVASSVPPGIVPTVLGGLEGFGIMLALYCMGVLFSKYRARRMRAAGQEADEEEALGAGDVILAGILGLLLGKVIWFALLLGILLGGAVGILLVVGMLIRGKYGKNALMVFMPYGPCFVFSAFFILFLPNWIR